jgi:D-arabinose 5-phosphate isomerase GutQ
MPKAYTVSSVGSSGLSAKKLAASLNRISIGSLALEDPEIG